MTAEASKLRAIARLATNAGATEAERASAAMRCAELLAKGVSAEPTRLAIDPLSAAFASTFEVVSLRRERDALAEIALERKHELESLSADKKQLEEMLAAAVERIAKLAGKWKASRSRLREARGRTREKAVKPFTVAEATMHGRRHPITGLTDEEAREVVRERLKRWRLF